ncbi:MAG: hypothetical protein IJT00_11125 [Lachnospiraceae bacterium]|nr:hypothetical protein [Lachnospiraceae bacterium]
MKKLLSDSENYTLIPGATTGLAEVSEDGKLIVAYKDGVKKGVYTVTLEAGEAKATVKIRASSVPPDRCIKLKVQRKLNVVTGQSMIVVPNMKQNLNGGIVSANVLEEDFTTNLDSMGNIVIGYEGEKYNATNLKIGDLILQLYIGGGVSHLKDGKWPPGLTV